METAVENSSITSLAVEVQPRNIYGAVKLYPVSALARTLAELAGHTTLTQRDLELASKIPGVTITLTDAPQDIPDWLIRLQAGAQPVNGAR